MWSFKGGGRSYCLLWTERRGRTPLREKAGMHRLYENEDITVFWDSDRCFHARMCVSGCPGVFSFARKPWVDLSKAENPKIWKTVKTCPSGALGHEQENR